MPPKPLPEEQSPNTDDLLDDTASELEEAVENDPSEYHLFQCCYRLPPWLQFVFYALGGCGFLLIPCIVIVALTPENMSAFLSTVDAKAYVARWSIYLAICWLSLLVSWRVIGLLPHFIISTIIFFFRRCNENIRLALEFIVSLRAWLCWTAWMIIISIVYAIFFQTPLPQDPALGYALTIIQQILFTVTIFSVCVFVQKFFLHSIAVNFHRAAYADRITKSRKSVKIIDKLRSAIKLFEFGDIFNHHGSGSIAQLSYTQREPSDNKRRYSTWMNLMKKDDSPTKGMDMQETKVNIPPVSSNENNVKSVAEAKPLSITTAVGTVDGNVTLRRPQSDQAASPSKVGSPKPSKKVSASLTSPKSNHSTNLFKEIRNGQYANKLTANLDVSNDKQARKLAKQIFIGLGGSKESEIDPSSFEPYDLCLTQQNRYFDTPKEAKDAFGTFDQDGNGNITLKEMKSAVVAIFKERRSLSQSLGSLAQSLAKLDHFFYFFSILLTVLFTLPVWGISFSAILPFTSLILALSFIFGGAARNTFDCLIFIFVYHPYDTGDRVVIDKETMLVENVGLLTTTFVRSDGQVICAPNVVLSSKFINNLRRSGDQSETIEIQLDFYTPGAKLRELKSRMQEYVSSQGRDLHPTCELSVAEIENINRLLVKLSLKHKGNWQDMGRRYQRRNEFMFALIQAIKDLGIKYTAPPQMSVDYRDSIILERDKARKRAMEPVNHPESSKPSETLASAVMATPMVP